MKFIIERSLNNESVKKTIADLVKIELPKCLDVLMSTPGALSNIETKLWKIEEGWSKVKEGWNKLKEGCSELSEVLEEDDLSFLSVTGANMCPEHAAEITNALRIRGLLHEEGASVPPPSRESAPAVAAIPQPMAKERKPKRRGKRINDLFRDATLSRKWASLCKEFFASYMNDEIDSSQSNRVLQRFAWFLSVWEERGLLVVQIFSPAVRFLQALGFRLSVDFQTCTNALRAIFARREDFTDAKDEVLAFCTAHA